MTRLLIIRIVTILVVAALDGFVVCVLLSREIGISVFLWILLVLMFFCGTAVTFIQALNSELNIRYWTGKKEGYEEGVRHKNG